MSELGLSRDVSIPSPGEPSVGSQGEAKIGRASSYADWRDDFAWDRLRTLYLLGLVANPVFGLSDFLFYRDHWRALLVLRVVLHAGYLLVFFAFVRRRAGVPPQVPLMAFVLIGNLCIAQMTVHLGGFPAPYYSGLNLVFLAAAVIVPVFWLSHLAAQAGSLLAYYGLNLLALPAPGSLAAAWQNSFFLVWTCVACVFSALLYERLQVAEFEARLSERRAREELEASHQKLLELDRLKDQFFANVNHELRTPLTLSLAAFTALRKLPLDNEMAAVVQSGLRNTSRLLFLINELLELARFERGRAELRTACVDLCALMTNVAANFQSSERPRVHVESPAHPVPALVDVRKMTTVLSNLLSNAFKFSDPELGQVWISLAADDDSATITVRDNGIGIPADQFDRIFDRFTQVEGHATRRFEGTGIGLALAKEIVTLHGGTIAVQSTLGAGSTFTITLPRGNVAAQSVVPVEVGESLVPVQAPDVCPSPEDGEAACETNHQDRPLLLVVDDNQDMRAYLARLLGDVYRVVTAADGADALKKVRRLRPSLVVADVMMPVMSGRDLLVAIRSEDALRTTPVILLTAHAGAESRVESLEAGADDYVSKPFSEDELLARIKNQLRIHRQARELDAKAAQTEALYAKLETVNAELRALSLRKSEFVSIVSHDLRTPLTAIGGFVENLLDGIGGPLTDKQRHYLERIRCNIDRLVRMIHDLLDLSRIEAGTMRLACKTLPVAEVIHGLMDTFQPLMREKGLAFRTTVEPPDAAVWADGDKLAQVLTNLVQNACKFTPSGGAVSVTARAGEPGFVEVCVSDTGCGIPPEEAAHVFDKFYRGASSSGEPRGVGLGLAIAKHFVELHRGRIWVENEPGEGSRFYFTIPRTEIAPAVRV